MKSDRDRENDAIKAIQERNDIRNLLHANFQSINVWLLKQPASADDLKAYRELPESLVDPEFTSEVQKLTVVLNQQLRTPTLFNGTYLNGVKITTLLQQITSNLNTNGAISVPSVFRAMENETVARVYAEVVDEWQKRTEKLAKSLPIAVAALNAQLAVSSKRALEKYDDELSDCVLVEERTKRREELVLLTTKAKDRLTSENHELLLKLIRKVVTEQTNLTKVSFESFCARVIPIEESRVLEQEFHQQKTKNHAAISDALQEHPEAADLPEYKYALLENEEVLTEFLSFKLVQNEARVKEEKITRLQDVGHTHTPTREYTRPLSVGRVCCRRAPTWLVWLIGSFSPLSVPRWQEAIAQQKVLIEQNRRLEEYLSEEKQNTKDMVRRATHGRTHHRRHQATHPSCVIDVALSF